MPAIEKQARMPMRGVVYALLASVYFGVTTPLAKILVSHTDPVLLAGLLYLGSGIGLWLFRLISKQIHLLSPQAPLRKADWKFLAGAIITGGVFAPVMLMLGITTTPASTASLFLNAESVFTALIAWFVFKENFDARIAWGMAAICAGGIILSVQFGQQVTVTPGAIFIFAACLGWAIDNNLTRKVASADPSQIACYKGLIAGSANTLLAFFLHAHLPNWHYTLSCMLVGLLGFGVSLVLYVLALRHIGAARTGAYFAIAPFLGALISIIFLGDKVTGQLLIAGSLMALGIWLHLTEQHSHQHIHEPREHEHEHTHDEHHQHTHDPFDPPGEPHTHLHQHERLEHEHPHFPDQHHFHEHE